MNNRPTLSLKKSKQEKKPMATKNKNWGQQNVKQMVDNRKKKPKKQLNYSRKVGPGQILNRDYLFFVWSPEGTSNPLYTYPSHKMATAAAHNMAKKYAGQSFYVGEFNPHRISYKPEQLVDDGLHDYYVNIPVEFNGPGCCHIRADSFDNAEQKFKAKNPGIKEYKVVSDKNLLMDFDQVIIDTIK